MPNELSAGDQLRLQDTSEDLGNSFPGPTEAEITRTLEIMVTQTQRSNVGHFFDEETKLERKDGEYSKRIILNYFRENGYGDYWTGAIIKANL